MQHPTKSATDLHDVVSAGNGLLGKLLTTLSADVREALLTHATLRDVAAGSVLLGRGESSAEVGYVIAGTLAMTQVLEHERTHIVGLLVPTDIFGRLFDGPSSYQIEALTPARIVAFPRDLFEMILRENPEAERMFLVHLLDEMDAAREWLLLMSGRKVINRLASFLMIMARRERWVATQGPVRLTIPLSRKDLALYLGARAESLSRAFHKLERDGVLHLDGPYTVEIRDLETLAVASGDDLTITSAKIPA